MTIVSGTLTTFATIGQREDLADEIFMISPTETPFMAAVGKTKATAVTHEWQTDTLAAAAANAQLEGDDFTFATPAVTTRLANALQISYETVVVSKTASAVNTAGRTREMVYQLMKRQKELRRDMEFTLTNNQAPVPQASASTTVARALRPLCGWYATNDLRGSGGSDGSASAAATNGTQRALDETTFKQALRLAWVAGGEPDMVMVGPLNKQNISAFAGNATRQIMANDRRLIAGIGFYEHDFGIVKIVPNRFSRERDVHVLDTNYWAVAYLRNMKVEDIAPTGDADKGVVICEYTLESRNEAASAIVADVNDS